MSIKKRETGLTGAPEERHVYKCNSFKLMADTYSQIYIHIICCKR